MLKNHHPKRNRLRQYPSEGISAPTEVFKVTTPQSAGLFNSSNLKAAPFLAFSGFFRIHE
jgi:hypothetical protein